MTAAAVTERLEHWRAAGWDVLHDVPHPGSATARLDHVAVGPGGVLVVDDQEWLPAVSTTGGLLRCGGRSRSAECRAVAAVVAGVSAVLEPRHRTTARGALALVHHDLPAMVVGAGTVVVGLRDLDAWREGLPQRLDAAEVASASGHLRAVLGASPPPVQLTLEGFLAGRG